jgi:hypothetical protein
MDRGFGAEQHQVVVDYHSALVNQAGRPRRLPGRQLLQIAAIALQCLDQETAAVALHHGSRPPAATHAGVNPAA